jgi:AraC-like DNA-binding protein
MYETRSVLLTSPTSSLRLCGAGTYDAQDARDIPPHQHSSWELVYYRSGKVRCSVGGKSYEAQSGVLVTTPPRTPHGEHAAGPYSTYYVSVEAPPGTDWPTLCVDDADYSLGRICGAIVREWNGSAPDKEQMLDLLLGQLDLHLRREGSRQKMSVGEQIVRKAERLLEERYATRVTVESVAREVGISSSSLRTHFGRARGKTPIQHLHSVRVQHALQMLRTSSLTLERIADLCGFDSASHLSRHIKRATGTSPGSLRNGFGNWRH